MRLIGIDCWSTSRVSGIVDMGGPVYVNFLSKKGMLPLIDFDHPFKKADFKDIRHFVGVVGKFLPYTKFWNEPVKVESLQHKDLIKPCREKFPTAEYIPRLRQTWVED